MELLSAPKIVCLPDHAEQLELDAVAWHEVIQPHLGLLEMQASAHSVC